MEENADPNTMAIHEALICLIERHCGKQAAIKQKALLAQLHGRLPLSRELVPNTRTLLGIIHDLRRGGVVIASSAAGYYQPVDAEEAHEYVRDVLQSRAMDLLMTCRAQRRAIYNQYGRQIPMDLRTR